MKKSGIDPESFRGRRSSPHRIQYRFGQTKPMIANQSSGHCSKGMEKVLVRHYCKMNKKEPFLRDGHSVVGPVDVRVTGIAG